MVPLAKEEEIKKEIVITEVAETPSTPVQAPAPKPKVDRLALFVARGEALKKEKEEREQKLAEENAKKALEEEEEAKKMEEAIKEKLVQEELEAKKIEEEMKILGEVQIQEPEELKMSSLVDQPPVQEEPKVAEIIKEEPIEVWDISDNVAKKTEIPLIEKSEVPQIVVDELETPPVVLDIK